MPVSYYGRRSAPCGVRRAVVSAGIAGRRHRRRSSGVVHDAVVGPAGTGAAGAGAVAGEHLRGGPAVQFHQVGFGPARSSRCG